ncbi:hypothetical protein P7C70_g5909, partial [Phenoliferia sp. Uapishka_3]
MEDYGDVPLPSYSGRLSNDWTSHEARLAELGCAAPSFCFGVRKVARGWNAVDLLSNQPVSFKWVNRCKHAGEERRRQQIELNTDRCHPPLDRLKAWLRLKNIPSHAREASDILTLSLQPNSQASRLFDFASPSQRLSFDEGVLFLRSHFDSLHRKRLAQASSQNALSTRTFRERGKRTELIKDLLSEIEPLLLRAGIVDDRDKKEAFTKCFVEFPRAMRLLGKTTSYEDAVSEMLRWEGVMVQKEHEELSRIRKSHDAGVRPLPIPPQTPQHSPSLPQQSATLSAPLPNGTSNRNLTPPHLHTTNLPPPVSESQPPRSSSAHSQSTIEDLTITSLHPNHLSPDPFLHAKSSSTESESFYDTYSHPPPPSHHQYDSVSSGRRSLSFFPHRLSAFNSNYPTNQYEKDGYDFEDGQPSRRPQLSTTRSRSVDFIIGGSNTRRGGLDPVGDVDGEGDEDSGGTPEFVHDAMEVGSPTSIASPVSIPDLGERAPRRSMSALGSLGSSSLGGIEGKRQPNKLIRKSSLKERSEAGGSRRGSQLSGMRGSEPGTTGSSMTVTKSARIKSWFGSRKNRLSTQPQRDYSTETEVETDIEPSTPDGGQSQRRSSMSGLAFRGSWMRSAEKLRTTQPSIGSPQSGGNAGLEPMGRPAKVRGGGRMKP